MAGFAIVYLKSVLNKKLKYEDIRKITDLPVVGKILHNDQKTSTIVFANTDSVKAEAFRSLRSRLQFFTKDARSPVILVTSSTPEEGKTHVAINLASAYSLLGKKTVIVGFDLRRPKLFQDFNLSNEKGISTYLIGQNNLQEIIQDTSFENLFVIPAGPIPPNPSELIALEKSEVLLNLLREKYDYIIIDSPPIGIVSDALHLASLADTCLLIVRPGHTLKNMLNISLSEIKTGSLKSVSLVINDIPADSKYGYGEKYGYSSETKHSKRSLFNRKEISI